MRCARCLDVDALECISYGDVELDHCRNCRGVWLDAGELTALKEWFSPGDAFVQDAGSETEGSNDSLGTACPHDETPLQGCVLPETVGFDSPTLDICPTCLGIWVDGWERATLHAILMKRRADDLDTEVKVLVPAPTWMRGLQWFVPRFLYTALKARR